MSLRVLLIVAWAVLAASNLQAAERAGSKGEVDEPYELALSDFRQDRIKDSAQQLKLILQNDPDHNAAAMLLGTIYYQEEKMERARSFFERSDPSVFSVETSFAYGATYMEFGDYRKAALGFRHAVKAKGPYREFAVYYLGVIYYKAGQWSRSRRFFQSVDARELPVFLRVNRRRYLSELRHQQDKMLDTIISANHERGSADLNDSGPSKEIFEVPRGKGKADGAGDGESLQHASSLWEGSVRPALRLTQQSSSLSNHGISHDTVAVLAHRESVQGEAAYRSARENARFSAQLQMTAGNTSYDAKVQKTEYFKLDQTTGTFTSQSDRSPSESGGFTTLRANVGLGLSADWQLEFGGSFLLEAPHYKGDEAWGQGGLQSGLRYEGKDLECGMEAAVAQAFDQASNRDAVDLALRGDIEKRFDYVRVSLAGYYWDTDRSSFISPDRFRFTLVDPSLRYRVGFKSEMGASGSTTFTFGELSLLLRASFFDRTIDKQRFVSRISSLDDIETAVDGGTKFLTSVSYPIWDSLSVNASFGYNVLTAYLYTDRDSEGLLVKDYLTDVEQMTYQVGGAFAPAEWIILSASYAIIANGYADKQVATPEFKKGNPDSIENSSFYLTITKSF